MNWGMLVRRAIVVLAVVLAVGIGYLQYIGLSGRKRARESNFIEDASPIPNAYRRALGPAPPMVLLTIEPTRVTAHVLSGTQQITPYLFERERGFVVAAPAQAYDEEKPLSHAFALSAIDFVAFHDVLDDAQRELGIQQAAQVVIDRPADAEYLRCRVHAAASVDGGVRVAERKLNRRVERK